MDDGKLALVGGCFAGLLGCLLGGVALVNAISGRNDHPALWAILGGMAGALTATLARYRQRLESSGKPAPDVKSPNGRPTDR